MWISGTTPRANGALALAAAAGLLIAACSSTQPAPKGPQPTPTDTFSLATTDVILEVDYAPNAQPYVGDAKPLDDVWTMTQANLERLLPGKTVTVPHKLEDMEALDDPGTDAYTADLVLAIAKDHRNLKPSGKTVTFYAVWLKGYYKDDKGTVREDVLGISIGDTGVIAIFKPVIQSGLVPGNIASSRVLEQATLIHEIGHALGYVNNGLPMAAPHHDANHGAHCTNPKCIMYWENEGPTYVRTFVADYVKTGNEVLFGPECIADAEKASGKK